VGGLAVVLIVMLVVVFVAQSLNKREIADTAKMSAPLTKALGLNRSAGKSEVPEKKKSTTATLVAIGSTVAVLSGVIAFAKEINNGDIVPEVREIAAGELNGTMINARNSDPVVLIVPGSGPTDRDGNNPMGLKTDAYKLLAEGLSEERISTVRVDKRGMFGSAGAGDPNISSPQAYVDDIHAWIDAIKTERGSKCVFLLGHSEGAVMVSLAAEGRKDVCGLILVSGMGRKMGDVIREQLTSNPANAPVLGQALGALSELEAGRHVDVTGMHPALLALFNPKVQGYLISMFAIDPVEAVRKANKDTLIVQGERDLQVSVADARLLDKAPHTRLRLIGHMNHVLKDAPEDRAGNIATYSNPSLPLSKDLVKYVRRFVKDKD
jgi:pimeloyl-ACP methyl ester carboxylesterase